MKNEPKPTSITEIRRRDRIEELYDDLYSATTDLARLRAMEALREDSLLKFAPKWARTRLAGAIKECMDAGYEAVERDQQALDRCHSER